MGLMDRLAKTMLKQLKTQNPYEYDLLITPSREEALRDRFTRTMLINSVWYGGNELQLKQLYQRELKAFKIGIFTSDELNYFWASDTDGTNIRKVHSGVPQLISEKMVDLLISNGWEYSVYKDDELKEEDEDNKARLEAILEDNDFGTLLQEGIETASWAGGVAYKISTNPQFDWPILEVIQPEEYEPVIKSGRIVADIFIKHFLRGSNIYKLKEEYGVDAKGGYIRYTLYRKVNEDWVEAPLTDLKETKDLEDISFPGVYKKFSLYIPNKLPNSEFRGSRLGESDYSGSHGLFDAIDEVVSSMVQEYRDARVKNFWPDGLLPKDPLTQKQYIPSNFKKDFVVYASGIGEKEKPETPIMLQGEIHSEKYLETYKKLIETVLNNAGLSPQSVGVTGLESTAASEESQELREKTSIRTREKKLKIWTPALNELFTLLLTMDDIYHNQAVDEYKVRTVFNDYKIQTVDDKTRIASVGITSKTWDIKSAVEYIHDEMTPEEQLLMVVRIKIENGINVFTKEEELVYKKFVQDTLEEATEAPEQEAPDEEQATDTTEEADDV